MISGHDAAQTKVKSIAVRLGEFPQITTWMKWPKAATRIPSRVLDSVQGIYESQS